MILVHEAPPLKSRLGPERLNLTAGKFPDPKSRCWNNLGGTGPTPQGQFVAVRVISLCGLFAAQSTANLVATIRAVPLCSRAMSDVAGLPREPAVKEQQECPHTSRVRRSNGSATCPVPSSIRRQVDEFWFPRHAPTPPVLRQL